MRWWASVLLAGCGFQAQPSSSAGPADAAFDAARDCPPEYAFMLSDLPSRYRIITAGHKAWEHSADCANDLIGATHLVALDTAEEIAAVQTQLDATTGLPSGGQGRAWIGGVQLRAQATDSDGWLSITGGPLLPSWDPGEPNDGGDNVENDAENYAFLERTRSTQIDISGAAILGAICECDGKPVDAAAGAAIVASTTQ